TRQHTCRPVANVDLADGCAFGDQEVEWRLTAQTRTGQPEVDGVPCFAQIHAFAFVGIAAKQETRDLVRVGQQSLDLCVRGRANVADHRGLYGAVELL